MPASSAKRRSARKREPTSRQRSSAVAANNESPSRPAKRRRTTNAAGRRQPEPEPEPTQDHIEDEASDDEGDNQFDDPSDQIIPVLKEASYYVAVTTKHANKDVGNTVSAYAKIAGKSWTYYVLGTKINIGRCSDQNGTSEGGTSETPQGEDAADIDLGPHKLVSRTHATIYYDSETEVWHISVIGRNGVRLNNQLLRKNQDAPLKSGDILLIADTEMMFVSPGVAVTIQPEYFERLNPDIKAEEPATSSSLAHAHPQPQQYREPTHISPYGPPEVNSQATAPATQEPPDRQSTPVKNLLQAPYLSQNADPPPATTPVHRQASVVENGEQQVDYSSDAAKHTKPPMSYATLIGQAILSTPEERISLNGIYEWIKKHFAYYRHIEQGWQNSIRHNLSLNPAFDRRDRDSHAPGKGGLWFIVPEKVEEHRRGGLKITSRGGARQSSNPSSPVPKRSPKKKTPPKKSSPAPPSSAQQAPASDPFTSSNQQDAQTPSRAPRPSALTYVENQHLPQLSDDASPLPHRSGPYNAQHPGQSPPTLSSSAMFDDSTSFAPAMITPLPRRVEPRQTAPSTQKLPSHYLPQSSPAPFWKQLGSTPYRLPETSPIKIDEIAARNLQSSSPPPPLANGSPTFARFTPEPRQSEPRVNGVHSGSLLRPNEPAPPMDDDRDDEAPLDLMSSFPKIGERANGVH